MPAPKNERQYYVLLVGINDYPAPVSKLGGCLKDLDQVQTYLQATVGKGDSKESTTASGLPTRTLGPLHLCRLENEQATHSNIITGFREFLRQAGPDDTVWFHFSGHGSEQFTAEAFLELEPNGKDQTLVCYQAKKGEGQLHLADKELAVLLHEVEHQDMEGQPKESPHIVVSLDCCHSGSGTRKKEVPEFKSRQANFIQGMTRWEAQSQDGFRDLENLHYGSTVSAA